MTPTNNMRTREEEWVLREKYGGVESDAYRADLERLAQGEPVAYVIGFSTFLGCTIDLSQRPLIPRPETEYWVEKAIRELQSSFSKEGTIRCLDVFAGSGCVGIAVLSHMPNAHVDFIDIEPSALEQIKLNLELNKIDPARYNIYLSDVFQNLPAGKQYQAILANPPYIAIQDKASRVDQSVLDHEPHTALFAEDNGLALISKTVAGAKDLLIPRGRLYIEHDDLQVEAITGILEAEHMTSYTFKKDQFGLYRWVEASQS